MRFVIIANCSIRQCVAPIIDGSPETHYYGNLAGFRERNPNFNLTTFLRDFFATSGNFQLNFSRVSGFQSQKIERLGTVNLSSSLKIIKVSFK